MATHSISSDDPPSVMGLSTDPTASGEPGAHPMFGGFTAEADEFDPAVEEAYWRNAFITRPYYKRGTPYQSYASAYRFGWESYSRYPNRGFDDFETELRIEWEARNDVHMIWEQARRPARDAWDRLDQRREEAQARADRTIPPSASNGTLDARKVARHRDNG